MNLRIFVVLVSTLLVGANAQTQGVVLTTAASAETTLDPAVISNQLTYLSGIIINEVNTDVANVLAQTILDLPTIGLKLLTNISALEDVAVNIKTSVVSSIDDLSATIEADLTNLKNNLNGTLTGVGAKITNAVANLDLTTRTGLYQALSIISSAIATVKGEESDGADVFAAAIDVIISFFKRNLTTLKTQIEAVLDDNIDSISDLISQKKLTLSQLISRFTALKTLALSTISTFLTTIKNNIQLEKGYLTNAINIFPNLSVFGNALINLAGDIVGQLSGEFGTSIAQIIANIPTTGRLNITLLTDVVENLKTSITSSLTNNQAAVIAVLTNLKNTINDDISSISSIINSIIVGLDGGLTASLKEALSLISTTIYATYGTGLEAATRLKQVLDILIWFINQLFNDLNNDVGTLLNSFERSIAGLYSSGTLTFPVLVANIKILNTQLTSILNTVLTNLKIKLDRILILYGKPTNDTLDSDDVYGEFLTNYAPVTLAVITPIKDSISTIINNFNTADLSASSIINLFNLIKSEILRQINSVKTTVSNELQNLQINVGNSLDDVLDKIIEATDRIGEPIGPVIRNSLTTIPAKIIAVNGIGEAAASDFKNSVGYIMQLLQYSLTTFSGALIADADQTLNILLQNIATGSLTSSVLEENLSQFQAQLSLTTQSLSEGLQIILNLYNDIFAYANPVFPNINVFINVLNEFYYAITARFITNMQEVVNKIIFNINGTLNLDVLNTIVDELNTNVANAANANMNTILTVLTNIKNTIGSSLNNINSVINTATAKIDTVYASTIRAALSSLSTVIINLNGKGSDGVTAFKAVLDSLIQFFKMLFGCYVPRLPAVITPQTTTLYELLVNGDLTNTKLVNILLNLNNQIELSMNEIRDICKNVHRIASNFFTNSETSTLNPKTIFVNLPGLINAIIKDVSTGVLSTLTDVISDISVDSLLNIPGIVNNIKSTVISIVKSIEDSLEVTINEIINNIDNSLATISSIISSAVSNLDDVLVAPMKKVLSAISSAVIAIQGTGLDAVNELKLVLNTIQVLLKMSLNLISDSLETLVNNAAASLEETISSGSITIQGLTSTLNTLKNNINSVIKTLPTTVKTFLSNLETTIINALNIFPNLQILIEPLGNLGDSIFGEIVNNIRTIIKNNLAGVTGSLNLSTVLNIIKNISENIITNFNTVLNTILNSLTTLNNSIGVNLNGIDNIVSTAFNGLNNNIANAIITIFKTYTTIITSLQGTGYDAAEAFKNTISMFTMFIKEVYTLLSSKTQLLLSNMRKSVVQLFQNGLLTVHELNRIGQLLGDQFEAAGDDILNTYGTIMQSLFAYIGKAPKEDINFIVEQTANLLQQLLNTANVDLNTSLDDIVSNLPENLNNVHRSKIIELFSNVEGSLIDVVKNVQEPVKNLLRSLDNNLTDPLNDIFDTLSNLASNVDNDIKNIIEGIISHVVKIKGVGEGAVKELKEIIQILLQSLKLTANALLAKVSKETASSRDALIKNAPVNQSDILEAIESIRNALEVNVETLKPTVVSSVRDIRNIINNSTLIFPNMNVFTTLVSKFSTDLSNGLFDKLSQVLVNRISTINGRLDVSSLFKLINDLSKDVFGALTEYATSVTNSLTSIKNKLGSSLIGLQNIITKQILNDNLFIGNAVRNVLSTLSTNIAANFGTDINAVEVLKRTIDNLIQLVQLGQNALANQLSLLLNNVASAIYELIQKGSVSKDDIINLLNNLIARSASSINIFINNVKDIFVQIAGILNDPASTVLNSADIVNETPKLIKGILSDLTGTVSDALEEISNVSDIIGGQIDVNSITNILNGLKSKLSNLVSSQEKILVNVITEVTQNLGNSLDGILEKIPDLVSGLDINVGKAITESLSAIISSVIKTYGTGEEAVKELKNVLNLVQLVISRAFSVLPDQLQTTIDNTKASIAQAITEGSLTPIELSNLLKTLKENINSIVKNVLTTVENVLKNTADMINNSLDVLTSLKTIVKPLLKLGVRIMNELSNRYKESLADLLSDLTGPLDLTKLQQLINGLNSKFKSALDTIIETVLGVISDVRNQLGVNLDNVDQLIANVVGDIEGDLSDAHSEFLSTLATIIQASKGSGIEAVNLLKNTIDILLSLCVQYFNILSDVNKPLLSHVNTVLSQLLSNGILSITEFIAVTKNLENSIDSTFKDFLGTVDTVYDLVASILGIKINQVVDPSEIINALPNYVNELVSSISSSIYNIFNGVISTITLDGIVGDLTVPSISIIINDLKSDVINWLSNLGISIDSVLCKLQKIVGDNLLGIFQKIAVVVQNLNSEFSNVLGGILSTLSSIVINAYGVSEDAATELKNIIETLKTLTNRILNLIKVKLETIIDDAVPLLVALIDKESLTSDELLSVLSGIKDEISKVLEIVAAKVLNGLNSVNYILNVFPEIGSIIEPLSNIASRILKKLTNNLIENIIDITSSVTGSINLKILTSIGDDLNAKLSNTIEVIKESIISVLNDLNLNLRGTLIGLADVLRSVSISIGGSIGKTIEDFLGRAATIVSTLNGIGMEGVKSLKKAISALTLFINEIFDSVETRIRAALSKTLRILMQLLGESKLNRHNLVQNLKELADELGQLDDKVPKIIEHILRVISKNPINLPSLVPDARKVLNNIINLSTDVVYDITKKLNTNLKDIVKKIENGSTVDESLTKRIIERVLSAVDKSVWGTVKPILEVIEIVKSGLKDTLIGIEDKISKTTLRIPGLNGLIGRSLRKLIFSIVEEIIELRGFGGQGVREVKRALTDLQKLIKIVLSSLKEKLESSINDVSNALNLLNSYDNLSAATIKSEIALLNGRLELIVNHILSTIEAALENVSIAVGNTTVKINTISSKIKHWRDESDPRDINTNLLPKSIQDALAALTSVALRGTNNILNLFFPGKTLISVISNVSLDCPKRN